MNQIDKIKLKDYISSVCKNYMSENVKHLLKTLLNDTFGVGTYFKCIEIYYNDRLYFAYMLDNEDNEDNKNVMMALKVPEYAEIEKDISEKLESGIPVKFFVNMETLPTSSFCKRYEISRQRNCQFDWYCENSWYKCCHWL